MQIESSLFSLLFFLSSLIYLYAGIYLIKIDPKEGVNRAFFFLNIALFVWSFGYALSNSAQDLESALFWRRLGTVGRMYLFSIVLHFMILLTHKKEEVKNKRLLLLIYIPALVFTYVFSISNSMASMQYNLIRVDYGWVDKPVENIWNNLYYFYFVSYMLISWGVLVRWKKRLKDKSVSKQANLIISALLIAILFGALLDVLPSIILEKPLPQLASVTSLLPVWAMYHAARYHNVFKVELGRKKEILATKKEQKKIFRNIAIAFFIGGLISIMIEYSEFTRGNDFSVRVGIVRSAIFFVLGTMIYLIQNIRKNTLKEVLAIMVMAASIPLITFQFIEYAGVTVWVFPIVIIVSSLIFSKRTLLISTTIASIVTQSIVWIIKPLEIVEVNGYDYLSRIVLFLIVFLVGFYVNKIYLDKIKENAYQVEFQKMVSKVSFDFVGLNQENFNEKVDDLLESIGKFFNVDRTYLFTIDYTDHTMTYSNEWCNNGINPEVGTIDQIALEVFPWWLDQLDKNNLVYIEDVKDMPPEAKAEQEQLERQGVKSLVSVPVIAEGNIQAFIGIDSVASIKKWTEEKLDSLYIMANVLSSGMMQIKSDKKIQFMAYYDNLTKLPNRFLFEDRVKQSIKLAKRRSNFIAIVFIDLDNFKSVNDTVGHNGGDILLKQVAQSLVGALRKADTVARFGGDEFMILLNELTDYKTVTEIADKIMKIFSQTFLVQGHEFVITASAGISVYPFDGEDSATLVKNADMAMYKAKAKGKNQYALCSKEMKEEVEESRELSNDLYRAWEEGELCVYYQPQVDLTTKKITGVECLLRWMHPSRGMISPEEFIPLAEKNSLINYIGDWVLREACIQNKRWQDEGLAYIDIAVNISAIQMLNPKLADNIAAIIKETGLDPKYIELEITESIAIKETNFVIEVLDKLKKIGVSIAIDDFGTEYSSLSRLKMLPIGRIKIDMQFVQGLEESEKDKAITMVIINLAKSLGLNVLAEGVETQLQLDFLNQKMCDNVQGYFYYKPMPAQEMEELLLVLSKAEGDDALQVLNSLKNDPRY